MSKNRTILELKGEVLVAGMQLEALQKPIIEHNNLEQAWDNTQCDVDPAIREKLDAERQEILRLIQEVQDKTAYLLKEHKNMENELYGTNDNNTVH